MLYFLYETEYANSVTYADSIVLAVNGK